MNNDVDKSIMPWFLGPKAENGHYWTEILGEVLEDYIHWRRNFFPEDPQIIHRTDRREYDEWLDELSKQLGYIVSRFKANFPFFSPRYIAHMNSELLLPSVIGYFAGMLYNSNNVSDEAAPITVPLELEVGKMVSKMLGYDDTTNWAHICSGGTVANIEALWFARTAKFMPLVCYDYCCQFNLDFSLDFYGKNKLLKDLSIDECLNIKPHQAISLQIELMKYIMLKNQRNIDFKMSEVVNFLDQSKYNINNQGIHQVLNLIGKEPKILVAETAHYCIKKAANLIGIGEQAVEFIPVDSHFRIQMDYLSKRLHNLNPKEFILAVVGIAGSTELGSVDPIHKMIQLRQELQNSKQQSFWIHIDAAWGGYIRTLFMDADKNTKFSLETIDHDAQVQIKNMNMWGKTDYVLKNNFLETNFDLKWQEAEVIKSFMAFPDADSITIDPHKLGFIPYPCGLIAFKNGAITKLIKQHATYISEENNLDDLTFTNNDHINALGHYILEGSKPGAAAAAAWLAHKSIPLNIQGHGKIIKASILSAVKFLNNLKIHQSHFFSFDKILNPDVQPCKQGFTFQPIINQVDTNIVCFIVKPMTIQHNSLMNASNSLKIINQLNEYLYNELTIKNKGQDNPYSQPYFVSKTKINCKSYSLDSVHQVLTELGISTEEYQREGLFVLRSVVMNPWHSIAQYSDIDYFMGYISFMHQKLRGYLNP